MRRAEAVKFYLVAQGVERNRIYVDGKGASQPVGDNTTSGGRARNNRVEIEVVGTRRGVEGVVDKVSFKAEVNFR
jgi:OOP family OmpA-OmpF porin